MNDQCILLSIVSFGMFLMHILWTAMVLGVARSILCPATIFATCISNWTPVTPNSFTPWVTTEPGCWLFVGDSTNQSLRCIGITWGPWNWANTTCELIKLWTEARMALQQQLAESARLQSSSFWSGANDLAHSSGFGQGAGYVTKESGTLLKLRGKYLPWCHWIQSRISGAS